jgi:hypothetical protein
MINAPIRCERCGEILIAKRVVWLELSITDGKYYRNIPEGHISQGGFPFGSTCAEKQIQEENEIFNTKNK